MITGEQLRAARGFLDMTRADVGEAARISPETVKNIEWGTFKPQEGTAQSIIDMFNARGVQFLTLSFGPYSLRVVSQTVPAMSLDNLLVEGTIRLAGGCSLAREGSDPQPSSGNEPSPDAAASAVA
jgi:DNA-binding XRE family transcriptional regulator